MWVLLRPPRFGGAKRLCGLEIDDQLELGRLLDRKIAGLRPAQNFVDIFGRALEQRRNARSVGHEAASLEITAVGEDRR